MAKITLGCGSYEMQGVIALDYGLACKNAPKEWEIVKGLLTNPITSAMQREATRALEAYLFVFKKNREGRRKCYCTACGRWTELDDQFAYEHGKEGKCPVCRKKAIFYEAWRGRGNCIQSCYFAFWKRSARDEKTIFQIGIICERDCSVKVDAEPQFILSDLTMFRERRAPSKFHALFDWQTRSAYVSRISRAFATQITTGCGYYYQLKMPHYESVASFRKAAKGTQLERCGMLKNTYEKQTDSWGIYRVVGICMRYPSIEYIYKMGQARLVDDVLAETHCAELLNLNGRTAQEVFRISPAVLSEIKKRKIEIRKDILYAREKYDESKETYTLDDLLETIYFTQNLNAIGEIRTKVPATIRKQIEYLERQKERSSSTREATAHTWRDYLTQCETLGMDFWDESVCMPKDLTKAHEEMTRRVQYKKNMEYEEKIRRYAKTLTGYVYEWGGLQLRPFKSVAEVIDEGTALSHCVGGYVRQYAERNTILCALRRADKPDEPWHTVEFSARDGHLVQCRGLRNQTRPEDKPIIDAFWQAFEQHRIEKKERKTA